MVTAAIAMVSPPHQHYVLDVLAIEQVGRYRKHHGSRRHPNQKGEVCDVEAPGDLVGQVSDHQSLAELIQVVPASEADHRQQKAHPGPVAPATAHQRAQAVADEIDQGHGAPS